MPLWSQAVPDAVRHPKPESVGIGEGASMGQGKRCQSPDDDGLCAQGSQHRCGGAGVPRRWRSSPDHGSGRDGDLLRSACARPRCRSHMGRRWWKPGQRWLPCRTRLARAECNRAQARRSRSHLHAQRMQSRKGLERLPNVASSRPADVNVALGTAVYAWDMRHLASTAHAWRRAQSLCKPLLIECAYQDRQLLLQSRRPTHGRVADAVCAGFDAPGQTLGRAVVVHP